MPQMIMGINCWANSLGGCSDKQSREHTISKTCFPRREVFVRGFPWCKEEAKRVRIETLWSKILCKAHNEKLSPVDREGGNACSCFRRARELYELRQLLKPDYRPVRRYRIDGDQFERWLLKTAINTWYPSRAKVAFGNLGDDPTALPRHFVDAAFGTARLYDPLGLYWVGHVGQAASLVGGTLDHVSLLSGLATRNNTDGDSSEYVASIAFSFQGTRFLLWLDDTCESSACAGYGLPNEEWCESDLMRHVNRISMLNHQRFQSQVIMFDWKPEPAPS